MNQVSFNGIQENFYAAKSAMGSFLGKRVSIIKENPNAVIAAIIVLATALIVGVSVKCYRAHVALKNQVEQKNNEVSKLESEINDLKSENEMRKLFEVNLLKNCTLELDSAENDLNKVKKDVENLSTKVEILEIQLNDLKNTNRELDNENINLEKEWLMLDNLLLQADANNVQLKNTNLELEKALDEKNNELSEAKAELNIANKKISNYAGHVIYREKSINKK